MTQSEHDPSVYLPLLTAELPEGWSVSEGLVFTSPSGTEVRVRLNGATEDETSDDLADRHLSEVAETTEHLVEHDGGPTGFARLGGTSRRFSFDGPKGHFNARVTATRIGAIAVSAGASWRPGHSDADAIDAIIDGLHLRHFDDTLWSEDELAVLAMLAGRDQFPTVNPEHLSSPPGPADDAVIAAVIRSLYARSLVEFSEGSVKPIGAALDVCTPALSPSLAVSVEIAEGEAHGLAWFGLGGDELCQILVEPGGVRNIRRDLSINLIADVIAIAGLPRDDPDGLAESAPDTESASGVRSTSGTEASDRLTLGEVLDPSSRVRLVQVQTNWIQNGIQLGGVSTLVIHDGRVRVAAEGTPVGGERAWVLGEAGFDAARESILDILPERIDEASEPAAVVQPEPGSDAGATQAGATI